jgi:hypothetical protein
MDQETANYIIKYFSQLQNSMEKLANKHMMSVIKLDFPTANIEATRLYKKIGWLTDDEDALTLVKLGEKAFRVKVAERIISEHRDEVIMNYCPKCNRLTRTPTAKQCRHCEHNWH